MGWSLRLFRLAPISLLIDGAIRVKAVFRLHLFPLLGILHLSLEVSRGAAVGAYKDWILWGSKQRPDALEVPRVGTRCHK